MYVWLGLWTVAALCEAALYSSTNTPWWRSQYWRSGAALAVGVLLAVSGLLLAIHHWVFAVGVGLFMPYRFVNASRWAKRRLQPDRLRRLCLQAFRWMISAELLVFAGSIIAVHSTVRVLLGVLGALQLLCALVLLRVSTQTWENATPRLPAKELQDDELPSVSVLIPARDETTALQACLASLTASDYPKLEILVLDDCSHGIKTPEIIRSFAQSGVRFIAGKTPPAEWVAKNYGYEQLRHASSGEMLLFCGADTTFERFTIRRLVEVCLARNNDMMSVLPSRRRGTHPRVALVQTLRYYWELCLPRRMFKRPPVLSACWLIRAATLTDFGGFNSVMQSVSPEAVFARQAVVSDTYGFVRSSADMPLYSAKTYQEQYDSMIRLRYPQLHRRLELVIATTLFECLFFVAPFVCLTACLFLRHTSGLLVAWCATCVAITCMYVLVAVRTRLSPLLPALLISPFVFVADIVLLHVSLLRYEFGDVVWKGRNVCLPVMRVEMNEDTTDGRHSPSKPEPDV